MVLYKWTVFLRRTKVRKEKREFEKRKARRLHGVSIVTTNQQALFPKEGTKTHSVTCAVETDGVHVVMIYMTPVKYHKLAVVPLLSNLSIARVSELATLDSAFEIRIK